MTLSYSDVFLKRYKIARSNCEKCGTRLSLTTAEPQSHGYELLKFICSKCNWRHKILVGVDPTQSDGAKWLNSGLKAPD